MSSINNMLKQIVLNLKIIARVQKGGRVKRDQTGNISLEDDTVLQPFKRLYYGNDRSKAIEDITEVIRDACELAKQIMDSTQMAIYEYKEKPGETDICGHNEKVEDLRILIRELGQAKNGILNLKDTYKLDATVCSQIEIILNDIDGRIEQMKLKIERCHDRYVKNSTSFMANGEQQSD